MNKFKASNGWLTKALFADYVIERVNEYEPIYWLNETKEGSKLPCLKDKFMEMEDLTGYKFAKKWLGGFEHFLFLLESRWFKEAYDSWIIELSAKIKSEQLNKIKELAEGDGATALNAAKYLANEEYKAEKKSTRGRPSNNELDAVMKKHVREYDQARHDFDRMKNITVINGGLNTTK